ncbi:MULTISPECIES: hypothetical protein [unclassified Sedimentibacter]|uniref:hypothetical protein n=1 Tax=unclassified Sedimentibacter TaxID=2649220 RepID=UPI0027DFE93F|nr:hypothetical protein [Sedimentibacter sp. MB35-C1]WMJ77206.1 hypothetical protein RBQ61_16795 [Sedimentibacter sp. MB35-C1]
MNYILNKFISVRVIEDNRIIIKTPLDVIEIKTENIDIIVDITNFFKLGATKEQFTKKYNYEDINELFTKLVDKKVLIEQIEVDTINSDVYEFMQQFAKINHDNIFNVNEIKLLILGSSLTVNFLNEDLREIGFNNIINFELKYNTNDLEDISRIIENNKIDLVICYDSVFNINLCKFINKKCLENNISFLFSHFKNLYAIIGPIIMPHETPCLNCLELRKINNYEFIDLEKYYMKEYYNINNQRILYPTFFYKITSKLISLEIFKFYFADESCNLIGKELEIDLKNYKTNYNRILYNPQCQICS